MEAALKEIQAKLTRMDERGLRTEEREVRMEQKIDNINIELMKLQSENQERKRENDQLREIVNIQNKKIEMLERDLKRKNLVIFGIDEEEGEGLEIRQRKIKEVVSRTGVEIEPKEDIAEIRRVGRRENGKDRPLIVELIKGDKKNEIIRSTRNLRGTKWSISEDYPKEVQIQRKQLLKHMKMARNKGHRALVIYDKVVIDGEQYTLDDIERGEMKQIKENETGYITTPRNKEGARRISERSPTEEDKQREGTSKIIRMNITTSKN